MTTHGNDQKKLDGEVHRVDGIVELNNPPPFWWQMGFYISIVWALGYMGYYLLGSGPTLQQELQANLAKIEATKSSAQGSPEDTGKELRAAFASADRLVQGKTVYAKNCASCHAVDGGGGIGPNLADLAWIHGDGSIDQILKVVRDGVSDKGMPPWGSLLKSQETIEVAAYVRSLRGTTPAKAKPPQGNVVPDKADI